MIHTAIFLSSEQFYLNFCVCLRFISFVKIHNRYKIVYKYCQIEYLPFQNYYFISFLFYLKHKIFKLFIKCLINNISIKSTMGAEKNNINKNV